MRKTFFMKLIIYILAFIITVVYFKSSTVVLIALACFASLMLTQRGEKYKTEKKYKIIKYICILGFALIVLGHIILQNDLILIVGAFMFSVTLAPLIVKDFIENIKKNNE